MAKLSEATVGAKIGRLTIVEIKRIPYKLKNGVTANRPHAVCDCDCGTKNKEILVCSLGGLVVSCGCVRLEKLREAVMTHGRTKNDKTYVAWLAMKQRAFYTKGDYYHLYGGRGITVSEDFLGEGGFERFAAEVGEPPSSKHSLDRIDPERGYEPENIRWATSSEQIRNRRTTLKVMYRGSKIPLAEAVEIAGLKYQKVYDRLYVLKWPVSKALESEEFTGVNDEQS